MANTVEKIIFELEADARKFLDGLKNAFSSAQKSADTFNQAAKTSIDKGLSESSKKAEENLKILRDQLVKAWRQYTDLKAAANDVHSALNTVNIDFTEQIRIAKGLEEIMSRLGMTIQEAGQLMIESGAVEINSMQRWLQLSGETLISNQQLSDSVLIMKVNHDNLAKSIATNNAEMTLEDELAQKFIASVNSEIDAIRQETNVLNQSTSAAEKQAESSKKMGDAAKQNVNTFDNVTNSVRNLLTAFGIVTSIGQFINGLKEAAQAGIDFQQAQFNLQVQVKAAQRAIGVDAAGSMEIWKEKIKSLRAELGIFSETDITKAITQTSVLTRVLGLNADQQEEVVRLASVLAQTTGADLATAVDDVTKAMGGSSVVLDKYGLFIRDVDKAAAAFELGFTDTLKAGTNGLSSQQLAMATLQTVMKQVNPLMAELGGYQETAPGKIKVMDAAIQDQIKIIGEELIPAILAIKEAWLTVLEGATYVIDNINQSLGIKTGVEKEKDDLRSKYGGNKLITPGTGLTPITPYGTSKAAFTRDEFTGIAYYLPQQLAGDKAAIDAYEKSVLAEIDRVTTEIGRAMNERFSHGYKPLDPNGSDKHENADMFIKDKQKEQDQAFLDMSNKFGQEMIAAYNQLNIDLRDAQIKRNQDAAKANQDYLDGYDKMLTELKRKQDKLAEEFNRKKLAIDTGYTRDLAKIESDAQYQRDQIEQAQRDRSLEAWDNYYRALRDLDNQYYADIQDAVADNDAVAIKKLEKKYALDKEKLNNKLADELNDNQTSTGNRIRDLENETNRRREELAQRYAQELEDLNVWKKQENDDINTWQKQEEEDLKTALDQKLRDIQTNLDAEIAALNLHYSDKRNLLVQKLAEEYDLTYDNIQALTTAWQDYLGEDGTLLTMWRTYYQAEARLRNTYQPYNGIGPQPYDPNATNSGWNIPPGVNTYASNLTPRDNHYFLTIFGEDVSDQTLDKIVYSLTDVVQDMIVRNGMI